MTLQQLHYVITISETGSMTGAAEKLFVAQPSLTSSVKELEKEIGIKIFHRGGKGVTVTNDGAEFLEYARRLYGQYEELLEKYGRSGTLKKKFGVSTQHYSFAVKAFVEMVKEFDTVEYDFAIRETRTREIIADVSVLKSEIGILQLNDINRAYMTKLFSATDLVFHRLIECSAFVYLWKGHPLAGRKAIMFAELESYPCLSFEQGDGGAFYFAEEILSTQKYPRAVKANDRATMLNLMVGLNGYTLCSGIICEELNGNDFVAVPFAPDGENENSLMEIGYIIKKNTVLSGAGECYLKKIREYLEIIP